VLIIDGDDESDDDDSIDWPLGNIPPNTEPKLRPQAKSQPGSGKQPEQDVEEEYMDDFETDGSEILED
jgi:hypothetical protein